VAADSAAAEQHPASAGVVRPGGSAVEEEPAFPAADTLAAAAEVQPVAVVAAEAEQAYFAEEEAQTPAVAVAAEPAVPAADCSPAESPGLGAW